MLFAIAVLRTAWLCDDAFITLRTVDNFVAGLGLRWNVAERVQAFTHPLWVFLLTVPYYFTREPYFGTLILSIALSLGAFWILIVRVATSSLAAVVAAFVLILSKAFVEYSTSGLENPASHFLLAVWFMLQPASVRNRRLKAQFVVAGLLVANRLDLVLLLLP